MRLRLFNASALSSAPIRGNGLVLRLPEPGDYPAWRHLREESTSFLRPWEPRWPTDDLTRTGFRRRLMRYRRDAAENSGFTYFLEFAEGANKGDRELDSHGVKLFVDSKSYLYLMGTQVDFVDGLAGSGFKFENPNARRTCGCGESFSV